MKDEYISAFLVKNKKQFRISDYMTIRQELSAVDDKFFPVLISTSFRGNWCVVIGIILLCIAIFSIIIALVDSLTETRIWMWALLIGILTLCVSIFLLVSARKNVNHQKLKVLIKNLITIS